MESKIRLKYNIAYIKWLITILFLTGNIALLGLGNGENDIKFVIIYEVSVNFLAISVFVIFSIFPRYYYIIDSNGVSLNNKKGKEKFHIVWQDVIDINYIYVYGIIPTGMEINWRYNRIIQTLILHISPKQAKEVYESIPIVKAIMVDNGNYCNL